jgi:peroxiredoxin
VSPLRQSAAFSAAILPGCLVAACFVAGCFLQGCGSGPHTVRAASVKPAQDRKDAPEFTLKDADGKVVHVADYRGKVVLLDFFATWCGPCKIEIPWFTEMERKNKDRGFAVLGVSMDDEGWEVVKPFLVELGVNYRVVIGNDSTAQLYGGVDALPTTFLIDQAGKIAAVHVGLASKKEFEDGVQQLLQPAPGGIKPDRASLPVAPHRDQRALPDLLPALAVRAK